MKAASGVWLRVSSRARAWPWWAGHGFQDLDRHIWELAYMDPSAIKQG